MHQQYDERTANLRELMTIAPISHQAHAAHRRAKVDIRRQMEDAREDAAQVRMEAMSRLMANGDLPGWSFPAFEGGGTVMASRPIFVAAALCPLVRVGKRIGFDVRSFRLHMIQNADQNFQD